MVIFEDNVKSDNHMILFWKSDVDGHKIIEMIKFVIVTSKYENNK